MLCYVYLAFSKKKLAVDLNENAIVSSAYHMLGTTDSCMLGTNKNSSMKLSQLEGMFINFESPAQCRGIITSWRYCFYRPDLNNRQFAAKFMIYRQNSSYNGKFYLVRESVDWLKLIWSNIENINYQCQDIVLTEREQFEALPNDIVGVCFINRWRAHSISIVGVSMETNLLTYHIRNDGACSTGIEKLDTRAGYVEQQPSLVLHIYANIGELN